MNNVDIPSTSTWIILFQQNQASSLGQKIVRRDLEITCSFPPQRLQMTESDALSKGQYSKGH